MSVSFDDVQAAKARISNTVRTTPLLNDEALDARCGRSVWFKCENLQTGGSFKIRGAANFLYSLNEDEKRSGVVAYSSGNHGLALAMIARRLDIKATLVMPSDAPKVKTKAVEDAGAIIVRYDRHSENREEIVADLSKRTGAVFVPSFNHPLIVAGAGTVGLDIFGAGIEFDSIVTCLGGGGLTSGIALVAKHFDQKVKVFGVEPETANDFKQSFDIGYPIKTAMSDTIADGLRCQQPGDLTFEIVKALVSDILLVSEEEIKLARRILQSSLKTVVEPSGAVAAAAVLFNKLPTKYKKPVVIISGGNVDEPALN